MNSLTDKYTLVNRVKIHYLEGGKPLSSPYPVVFLHGFMLSADAYRASLNALTKKYRVIAPDLPGFGKSSNTLIEGYEDYSQILLSFFNKIEVDKLHLSGHSLGGGISIYLSATAPSLVENLILVDSAGVPLKITIRLGIQKVLEVVIQGLKESLSREYVHLTRTGLYNLIFRCCSYVKILRIALQEDLTPLLSGIESRCLVTWGARDLSIPLRHGQILAKNITGSKMFVVKNAYHDWCALQPSQFQTIVSSFINKA